MQKERKGNGLLIAILLIIILILISLVGFFIYNDYYLKEDSKGTSEIEVNNLTLGVLETYEEIKQKIESIRPELSGSDKCTGEFYLYEENVYNNKMEYSAKVESVINYIDLYSNEFIINFQIENNYPDEYELSEFDVYLILANLKKLFGPNEKIESSDKDTSLIFKSGDKYYLRLNNSGYGCEDGPIIFTQKIVKTKNEFKIYKKVGYPFDFSLSTDEDGKNIIAKVDEPDENTDRYKYFEEQMNENIDKFPTYIITFKLDSTGNYYFYSSEKT